MPPSAPRILYVNLSASFGGGPEHLHQLTKGMADAGIECFIATPFGSPYLSRLTSLAGLARLLDMPDRRFKLSALFRLVRFARKNEISIIHSHGKGAGLYARLVSILTGIKCVHTFHGLHLNYPPPLKSMYIMLERFFSLFTARCIAVSPGEAKAVLAGGLASQKQLALICNGVAVPSSAPIPAKEGCRRFKVIQITRFDTAKNSELIVDIALSLQSKNRLDDVEFLVLGDGQGRKAMEERVCEAGLQESFSFPGTSLFPRAFLKECQCCLSTSRWEGMPLAVLEAMSEGLPTIASDVIGNQDAVSAGETGFLFPLNSPQTAAEHILALLDDSMLRERMGLAAYTRARDYFSVDRMNDATIALYKKILTAD